MKYQINPTAEALHTRLLILKICREGKSIPEEFLIRIINLFEASDLNLETDMDEIVDRRKFLIIFIQQEYKISIKDEVYNFKKHHLKSVKNNKLNQAKFGQQTLKLLNLISFKYGVNPYQYFEELVKERFFLLNKLHIYTSEKFLTVTEFKRKLQNENSQLFFPNYTNVYDEHREPYSRDFINICLKEMDRSNTFAEEYKELKRIRTSLVSYLIDKKCVSTHDGVSIKESRGCKK